MGALAMIALVSCEKEYNCKCTTSIKDDQGNLIGTPVEQTLVSTEKCSSLDSTYTLMTMTYTFECVKE